MHGEKVTDRPAYGILLHRGQWMDQPLKQYAWYLAATVILLANVAIVRAYSGDLKPQPILNQLDVLRSQLDFAEQTNATVQLELDEARSLIRNDSWLNAQRAAEITVLVQEVLADSSNRRSLQGDNAMMGWSDSDGFYMSSSDGRFRLNIGGMIQTQGMARWVGVNEAGDSSYDQWRYGFGVSRSQLMFGGNVFGKGLEYYIEMGWGRGDEYNLTGQSGFMTARLWDAWVKFRPTSNVELKIGQFMLPFTRESLVRPQHQLAVVPSVIDFRMGMERTAAIQLDWSSENERFSLAISNGSPALFHAPVWGAFDPIPPWPALEKDTLYAVSMRHEWKLLGNWEQFKQFTSPPGSERGVMIGVAGHRQNTEHDAPVSVGGFPEGVFWGVTGDVTLQYDGASLFASVIYERVTDFAPALPRINLFAYILQGSTYVTNQTELFARYEAGGPDDETAGGDKLQILTVGVNHYVDGQDMKFTADVGFSFGEISQYMANTETGWIVDLERRNQVVLRTQIQLLF